MRPRHQQQAVSGIDEQFNIGTLGPNPGRRDWHNSGERNRVRGADEHRRFPLGPWPGIFDQVSQRPVHCLEIGLPRQAPRLLIPGSQNGAGSLREAKNQKSHDRERNENLQQGEAGCPGRRKVRRQTEREITSTPLRCGDRVGAAANETPESAMV